MTARLLLIVGALACADQPDPQDAARPEEARRCSSAAPSFCNRIGPPAP